MNKNSFAGIICLAVLVTTAHCAIASHLPEEEVRLKAASSIGGIVIGGSGAKGYLYERVYGYGIRNANEVNISDHSNHLESHKNEFVSQNKWLVSALREEMMSPGDITRIADDVAIIHNEFNRKSDNPLKLYIVGSSSVEKNRNTGELAKAIKEKIDDPDLKLEFISYKQATSYSLFEAIHKHRNSGMCSPYNNSLILGLDSNKVVIGTTSNEIITYDNGLGKNNTLSFEVIEAIESFAEKTGNIKTVFLTMGKSAAFPEDAQKIALQINNAINLPIRFVQDDDSDEIGQRVSNMVERNRKISYLPECASFDNSVVLDIGTGNAKLGYLTKTTKTYSLHSHEIPYGAATLNDYLISHSDDMCFALPNSCRTKNNIHGLVDLKKKLSYSDPRLFEETSKGYKNFFVVGETPLVTSKITRLGELENDYSCVNLDDFESVLHDASPLQALLERSLKGATKTVSDELDKHVNEYEGAEKTAFIKKMLSKMASMNDEVEKVQSTYLTESGELRSGALLTYWILSELSDSSYENQLWTRQQLKQLSSLFDGKSKKEPDIKNYEILARAKTAFDATDYKQAQKAINEIVAKLTPAHVKKLIDQTEEALATHSSKPTKMARYKVDKRIVREILNIASDKVAHDDAATAYLLLSDANAAIIQTTSATTNSIGNCQTHERTPYARQFLVPNRENDWLKWHIMNKEGVLIDALKYMGLIDLTLLAEPELETQFIPKYVPTVSKRSRDIRRD